MDQAEMTEIVVSIILKYYPATQAIYLFGSYAAQTNTPTSDIDLAVLLPPHQSQLERNLALSPCHLELENILAREIDLLNARQVSTVIQKELLSGIRIYCADQYAGDEFEMLTLSYYQKLNEERQGILNAFYKTGRAYAV